MAAKEPAKEPGLAPDVNPLGLDYRGNAAYSFDMGAPDKVFTCSACHSGGIAEFDRRTGVRHDLESTWDNDKDGSGFFSKEATADEEVDGDLFSYTPDEYSRGYVGKPHKFNWKKSGVLDTDCLLCHADRSQNKAVRSGFWTANNPTPANPRVFVFEKKNPEGKVVEISLGFPPKLSSDEISQGYTVDSVTFYSNPMERIVAMYYQNVIGECLENSGLDLNNQNLKLKAQTLTISVMTENLRHGKLSGFTIPYSRLGGTDYTYNGTGLSNFFDTFYLDPGAPNFSARDFLRNAFFESTVEGQPYVGAGMFFRATALSDNFTYDPTSNSTPIVRLGRAGFFFGWADTGTLMGIADPNDSSKPLAFVKLKKESDGTFKAVAYYDSNVTLSSVELPVLETSGHYTLCSPNSDTASDGVTKVHNGDKDDSLTFMCAQCHFAIPDNENRWSPDGNSTYPSWYTRRGIIGMGADVVKRAAVFSRESENDNSTAPIFVNPDGTIADPNSATTGLPSGYDVHFDKNKGNLSCLSCHGQDNLSEEEKLHHNPHNFLKGNDSAGEVMPALDYNPSVKTCIKCHWGSESLAAQAHETKFGPAAAVHISKIECQVCHIPYKTYWTFRFFNDLMGYSNNFDNRFMKFEVSDGKVKMFQFPPEWSIPAFAPTPTYGVNYAYSIFQTDDRGNDVIAPMTLMDTDPYRALIRWNDNGTMFGMWSTGANPQMKPFLFPWRWAPVIVKRWTIDDAGNQVLRAGLINPIIAATWMDADTGKVLYVRELNAAVKGLVPPGGSTVDPETADKEVPALVMRPASEAESFTGKPAVSMKDLKGNDTGVVAAVQLINGKFIYDNDGDMVPEIDSVAEYNAMKDALKQVLDKEDPSHPHDPVIFVGMAPFGVDHGVLPAKYALGAQSEGPLSCKACHNSDESKNRLSPAVYGGDMTKGRFVTLIPFALPQEAINDSKKAGAWKMPPGVVTVKTPDGRSIMGATQGAFMNWTSVPVESKEYAAYALITPSESDSVVMDGISISCPKGAVDTPTIIKVEKVENEAFKESALESAKSYGVATPVLAGEIYKIETKTNRFNLPVTFSLPYESYKVSGKVILLTSEDGKHWELLTSSPVNPENPLVTFATDKLSYFAIVGEAASGVIVPSIPKNANVNLISSSNGTAANITVTLPNYQRINCEVKVEGGTIDDSTEYDPTATEELAKKVGLAEVVIPSLKVIPSSNATQVKLDFSGIPQDKISSITAVVEKGENLLPASAVNVEKLISEGKVSVTINLSTVRGRATSDSLYVTLGVPSSAVAASTQAATSSGGGGGCSISAGTSPISGLPSLGVILSGLTGLIFGRRRKKN